MVGFTLFLTRYTGDGTSEPVPAQAAAVAADAATCDFFAQVVVNLASLSADVCIRFSVGLIICEG